MNNTLKSRLTFSGRGIGHGSAIGKLNFYRRSERIGKGGIRRSLSAGEETQRLRRAISDARQQGRRGLVLTCKDRLLAYYAKFGFVNEGVSVSTHGGVVWYQMRLTFER